MPGRVSNMISCDISCGVGKNKAYKAYWFIYMNSATTFNLLGQICNHFFLEEYMKQVSYQTLCSSLIFLAKVELPKIPCSKKGGTESN